MHPYRIQIVPVGYRRPAGFRFPASLGVPVPRSVFLAGAPSLAGAGPPPPPFLAYFDALGHLPDHPPRPPGLSGLPALPHFRGLLRALLLPPSPVFAPPSRIRCPPLIALRLGRSRLVAQPAFYLSLSLTLLLLTALRSCRVFVRPAPHITLLAPALSTLGLFVPCLPRLSSGSYMPFPHALPSPGFWTHLLRTHSNV